MATAIPRLVALSPGDLLRENVQRFVSSARSAFAAGLPALCLREHVLSDGDWLALLRTLKEMSSGPLLIAHDRCHLAHAAGVRAVHLGFRSLTPNAVRSRFDFDTVGLSTHAGDEAPDAATISYVFHGPVRSTPSKAGLLAPIGFSALAETARAYSVPVLAVGGLCPADAREAVRVGAHGVVTLRGVFGSEDPGKSTEAYLQALEASA